MSKKSKKRPGNMQKRKKVSRLEQLSNELIEENETQLAALAWMGYQQQGRGALIISYEEEDGIDVVYQGERGPMWREGDIENKIPKLFKLVQEYDPMKDIIIINGVPEDKSIIMLYDMELPPPVAHKKMQME